MAGPLRDIPQFLAKNRAHHATRRRPAPHRAPGQRAASTLTAVIEVVGVPASGVAALPDVVRTLIGQAQVVIGSPRLLETLAVDAPESPDQKRLPWPRPLVAGLDELLASVGNQSVVVLATGDPLDSGIGTTLISRLGREQVRIHPAVGSVALARARMGWSTREADVLSLVSTPPHAIRALLTPGRKIIVLSADEHTPSAISRELADAGWTARLTVLGNLGSERETRHEITGDGAGDLPRLNIVAVELPADGPSIGTAAGRPDDAYENDGQLTKREVRACAISALRPTPGQLLWDLGAGAGSVAIEWALHHPRCAAIAVERDPARADRIGRNAQRAGAVGVRVEQAASGDVVDSLPTPDAVFIGGGANTELIDRAWAALRPGGRIVVHTVTIDTEQVVLDAARRYGGGLSRISIERAESLGTFLAWKPARPVVEWSATKPRDNEESPA